VVSQTGVAPEQVVLSVHCTHAPLAEQAGVVGLLARHWLAVVQAVQVFAVQMGVAAEQVALVRHWTHCPPTFAVPAGAQSNPAQAPAPAWSHPTHALLTQKARAGSLQSVGPLHAGPVSAPASVDMSLAASAKASGVAVESTAIWTSGPTPASGPLATGPSGRASIN